MYTIENASTSASHSEGFRSWLLGDRTILRDVAIKKSQSEVGSFDAFVNMVYGIWFVGYDLVINGRWEVIEMDTEIRTR